MTTRYDPSLAPMQHVLPLRAVLSSASAYDTGRIMSLPAHAPATLGRGLESSIVLTHPSVSGRHAQITKVGADYVIADQGSTNGTYVNGQYLVGSRVLCNGDLIRFGTDVALRFVLMEPDEESAATKLYEMAVLDRLTRVHNRNYLDDRLDTEIAYAARQRVSLGLVMLDLDYFKSINDAHGHVAGDAVLRAVGGALRDGLRAEDLVARYGGEEFAVVVRSPGNLVALAATAERLRAAVGRLRVAWGSVQRFDETTSRPVELQVTASLGVALLSECEVAERRSLVALADRRLYRAKNEGRNRVVCSGA